MKRLAVLLLAALAAGCHKQGGPKEPELSDPFRPPPQAPSPYRLRGAQVLDTGDILLIVEVSQ